MCADDRTDSSFPIAQGALLWQPISEPNRQKWPIHLHSSYTGIPERTGAWITSSM